MSNEIPLDETHVSNLRSFWRRLDSTIYQNPSNPPDPIDLPLQSIIMIHGHQRFQEAFWNWIMMCDPDVMISKFLRARKWNVTNGLKMLLNTLKWRIERNVDQITENEEIVKQLKTGKAFIHGVDKEGAPVVRITAAKHSPSAQSAKALEEFVIYSIESVRLFMCPPVEIASFLVNLSGFGMSNMDWKCSSFMINCLEAYYPETLNAQIIHNAPWIFQGIWKIISSMIDPVVRSKVTFTKNNDDLCSIIDKSNLLKSEGGESDFTWSYIPPSPDPTPVDMEVRTREIANRNKLVEIYVGLTREWAMLEESQIDKGEGYTLARLRRWVQLMMRAHYFKLLPLIKPSSIYYRHQTLSHQRPGIINFKLNSNNSTSTEEKILSIGKESCRKNVLKEIKVIGEGLKAEGISLPSVDFEL